MANELSTIIPKIRQDLKDTGAEFSLDDLKNHIDDCLAEISQVCPFKAVEPIIVAANSRLLDISGITNLIRATAVEYPISDLPTNPRVYRNIEYIDNDTIEMMVDSSPSEVGTAGTITGVLTFTASSPTVTGAGALVDFDGELEAGSFIKPSDGTKWYRVLSIESDSSLTLEETVKSADAGADSENASMYRTGVALVHCEKVHQLTDSISTLNLVVYNVLIKGVIAKAARAWLNTMRSDIVPSSSKWYHDWVNDKEVLYRRALISITTPKAHEFYAR